jgi:hypothetical protein
MDLKNMTVPQSSPHLVEKIRGFTNVGLYLESLGCRYAALVLVFVNVAKIPSGFKVTKGIEHQRYPNFESI